MRIVVPLHVKSMIPEPWSINMAHPTTYRLATLIAAASLAYSSDSSEFIDHKAASWLNHATTERIAIVGMGDSNQRFGGHGWSQYMSVALGRKLGCWGTEVKWERMDDESVPAAGIPQNAANAFSYWYIPNGQQGQLNWRHGMLHIPTGHPFDTSGTIKFTVVGCGFTATGGKFHPTIRRDEPPWTVISSTAVSTHKKAEEEFLYETLLPADPGRSRPIRFAVTETNGAVIGPYLGKCLYAENINMHHGISYNTLYARGGQSLLDMLRFLKQETGSSRLTDYFCQIRRPLNNSGECIVVICSGLNDRNEDLPSEGPNAGFPGKSADAYRDNLIGIMSQIDDAWEKCGGKTSALRYIIMPSHPLSLPDDEKLEAYRTVARTLTKEMERVSFIQISSKFTSVDMARNGFYDKGLSTGAHLTNTGYEAISNAIAESLSTP